MEEKPKICLCLWKESWEQIFETLKWEGLKEMTQNMDEYYKIETGEHYSRGNFWAAIQELQRQFKEAPEGIDLDDEDGNADADGAVHESGSDGSPVDVREEESTPEDNPCDRGPSTEKVR